MLPPLQPRNSSRIGEGPLFYHTLAGFVACIQVASFWFVISRLEEILGRMALAGVGFSRVVVWLEGCILGRSGESGG